MNKSLCQITIIFLFKDKEREKGTYLCVERDRKNPNNLRAWSLINCECEDIILNTVLTPPLTSKAGTRVEGCSHIKDMSICKTSVYGVKKIEIVIE